MRESNLFKMRSMDSMSVARAGFIGLMRERRVVIPGAINRLVAFATRLLPRATMARIAGNLNENR
jgi:short-subunit dehydrogenase